MARVKLLVKRAARKMLLPFTGVIPRLIIIKKNCGIDDLVSSETGFKSAGVHKDIHPSKPFIRAIPEPVDGNRHWKFRDNALGVVSHSEPTFCTVLANAKVINEHGVVLSRRFNLVGDILSRHIQFDKIKHPLFDTVLIKKRKKLKGISLLLAAPDASHNYFHWMTDALPKLEIAKRAGIGIASVDHFIVSNPANSFQKQTLRRAGIDAAKLVALHPRTYVQCEQLIATSPACYAGNVSQWIIDFLRKMYASAIYKDYTKGMRIFITRRNSVKRRLLNEEQVFAQLQMLHFQKVYLEDLVVHEQAELFSSAEMIVGVHGAGFTNLVFCNPGTTVIEIFAPTYVNQCYWTIAGALQLNYSYLIGQGLDDTTTERHLIERDVELSTAQLNCLASFITSRI